MKKVIDISLGGVKFSLEEDAYTKLKNYLKLFESTISDADERKEIMEDIELRVAEIFHKEQAFQNQVVDTSKIKIVIAHLGEIEAPTEADKKDENKSSNNANEPYTKGQKKLYRSVDDKMLAGVCGGLAVFFGIDSTIIRIVLLLLLLVGGTGILAYIIVWIATKEANTVARKLEMQGYAPNAENIKRYTETHK